MGQWSGYLGVAMVMVIVVCLLWLPCSQEKNKPVAVQRVVLPREYSFMTQKSRCFSCDNDLYNRMASGTAGASCDLIAPDVPLQTSYGSKAMGGLGHM